MVPTHETIETILDRLVLDPNIEGLLTTEFSFQGCTLTLSVDPDGEPLPECLERARILLSRLPEVNVKALQVASNDLLSEYNASWRSYIEHAEHGESNNIEHPILTATQFQNHIRLSGVSVLGQSVEFCYSDMGLFCGHSIFVDAFDGIGFEDAHATLFG